MRTKNTACHARPDRCLYQLHRICIGRETIQLAARIHQATSNFLNPLSIISLRLNDPGRTRSWHLGCDDIGHDLNHVDSERSLKAIFSRRSRSMWKSILVIMCSLLSLVIVTAGTAEAKGGHGARSSGSRGQAHHAQPHPITAFQPKQVNHDHKHKHKHKPMGDVDGELDAPSSDTDEAEEAQNGEENQEADEAETALYGVEITGLFKGTAAKEGLEIGDIILNFNGTPTPTFEALADAVARSGSQAQVLVIREDGGERETVTLFPKDGRIGLSGDACARQ